MRKRTLFITATIPAILLGCGAAASAQSLTELAAKEKERREELDAEAARSFTDEDLQSAGGPLTASTVAAEATESEEEGEDEQVPDDQRRTRDYWQGRLNTLSERAGGIESRLNRPGFDQNIGSFFERQRLERELAEVRAEREALLEEARRAGAPPGWLR